MALVAEQIVEEWLNRAGYFTIRGIRLGPQEMDLLAVRDTPGGPACRHIEVQVSHRPVSYVAKVPKAVRAATGRAANSAKRRSREELDEGIREWIAIKFEHPEKIRLLQRLWPGPWTREVVLHVLKDELEVELFEAHGVRVTRFKRILDDLIENAGPITAAAGADLIDLIQTSERVPRDAPIV